MGAFNSTARQRVLLALSHEPQLICAIAQRAGLSETKTAGALDTLVAESFTIPDEGRYELTGPLSWFGTFQNAIRYYAKRGFIVGVPGDSETHLLLTDVRIKGGRPAGDPLTETVAVFACGRSAKEIRQVPGEKAATCADCVAAMAEIT